MSLGDAHHSMLLRWLPAFAASHAPMPKGLSSPMACAATPSCVFPAIAACRLDRFPRDHENRQGTYHEFTETLQACYGKLQIPAVSIFATAHWRDWLAEELAAARAELRTMDRSMFGCSSLGAEGCSSLLAQLNISVLTRIIVSYRP